jgi:hypothetical protein
MVEWDFIRKYGVVGVADVSFQGLPKTIHVITENDVLIFHKIGTMEYSYFNQKDGWMLCVQK